MRKFLAVAEELHFRRASEILHLSQPTLTLQIRQLEDEIGARLFERTSRNVSLTPAGVALADRVRILLLDIDSAILHTQRVSRGVEGSLSLVYVGTGASSILARSIQALQKEMPNIDLALDDCRPTEQVLRLIEGKADLGFMHTKFDNDQLESKVVQRDCLIAAVPADFPGSGPVDLRDLAPHTLIVPRPMDRQSIGIYEFVQGVFVKTGTVPARVLHANILNGLMLVAAGVGVSVVPAFVAETRMHNISFRPLSSASAFLELSAVWKRDNTSVVLKHFLRLLEGISSCAQDTPHAC
jgi:DNA-binding transcriptional LysR family regulator